MRRILLLVLLPLLTACGGGSTPSGTPGPRSVNVANQQLVDFKKGTDIPDCPKVGSAGVDGGLPSVTLPCLGGGRSVDLSGLRGPLIVNYWASWCGSCREEMPALAAYAAGQSQVRVLGIDFLDAQPGAALELARKSKVAYPLLADPEGTLDRRSPLPHVSGLPMTVFVARDGSIAGVEFAVMKSEADVKASAEKYLGATG